MFCLVFCLLFDFVFTFVVCGLLVCFVCFDVVISFCLGCSGDCFLRALVGLRLLGFVLDCCEFGVCGLLLLMFV